MSILCQFLLVVLQSLGFPQAPLILQDGSIVLSFSTQLQQREYWSHLVLNFCLYHAPFTSTLWKLLNTLCNVLQVDKYEWVAAWFLPQGGMSSLGSTIRGSITCYGFNLSAVCCTCVSSHKFSRMSALPFGKTSFTLYGPNQSGIIFHSTSLLTHTNDPSFPNLPYLSISETFPCLSASRPSWFPLSLIYILKNPYWHLSLPS